MYILFLKPRLLTPRPVLLWGQQVPGGGPTTTTLRQACWEPTATRRPGMVMEPRKAYVWGHTIQLLLIQGSAQRLLLHPHRLSWPTWDGFKNKTYSTWSLNVRNMKVFCLYMEVSLFYIFRKAYTCTHPSQRSSIQINVKLSNWEDIAPRTREILWETKVDQKCNFVAEVALLIFWLASSAREIERGEFKN